jgi:hypothetical protein
MKVGIDDVMLQSLLDGLDEISSQFQLSPNTPKSIFWAGGYLSL